MVIGQELIFEANLGYKKILNLKETNDLISK